MAPASIDDEEEYASSEDSDFAPDEEGAAAAGGRDVSDNEDEDEVAERDQSTRNNAKRKRAAQDGGDAEDAGFENSGDEAIIEKGKKRRKRTKGKDGNAGVQEGDEEEDDGDIRIKTRSQRAVEKAEKKTKVASGPVTVDVDALWAQMTSEAAKPSSALAQPGKDAGEGSTTDGSPARSRLQAQPPGQQATAPPSGPDPPDTIRIKRTYNFAGKVHTEQKVVARDSAEAKLYLASLGDDADAQAAAAGDDGEDDGTAPKRMPRRAFRSAFEPHTEQLLPRGDLDLAVSARLRARESARDAAAAARKLNTVEKSRMDWAGYVDREGIRDELALAGRAKGSFAERQDFLARSEARRDDEARRVRLAGKA